MKPVTRTAMKRLVGAFRTCSIGGRSLTDAQAFVLFNEILIRMERAQLKIEIQDKTIQINLGGAGESDPKEAG